MTWTASAFVVATALYAGFQWTIRMVVYPQFSGVGSADFVAYERAHQRRVSVTVGPLFAALVVATGALIAWPPAGVPWWSLAVAVVLLMVILGMTALLAVPLHRRLGAGFEAASHRRLLAVDSVRLAAALADVALAVSITRA